MVWVSVQAAQRVPQAKETQQGDGSDEGRDSSPNRQTPLESAWDEDGALHSEAPTTPAQEGEAYGGVPATPPAQGGSVDAQEKGGNMGGAGGGARGSGERSGANGGLDESTRLLLSQLTCPLTQVRTY